MSCHFSSSLGYLPTYLPTYLLCLLIFRYLLSPSLACRANLAVGRESRLREDKIDRWVDGWMDEWVGGWIR
ncbi:hypothetical protein GGS21DRAFT_495931 [Xylaria nigripes]|nr:hypothetical protein GGS21DRAFT_495931 [Xylaria nigripes]